MSQRRDEIVAEIMALHSEAIRHYIADFAKGLVPEDFVVACIGEIIEEAVGIALDDSE